MQKLVDSQITFGDLMQTLSKGDYNQAETFQKAIHYAVAKSESVLVSDMQ
jgi:hypothetical protein